jgi:phosphoenolpyruvate carboxylase
MGRNTAATVQPKPANDIAAAQIGDGPLLTGPTALFPPDGQSQSHAALHAALLQDLRSIRAACCEDPLGNPVMQLSLRIARRLEAGDITPSGLEQLVQRLVFTSFMDRAAHLRCYLGETDAAANLKGLSELVRGLAGAEGGAADFDRFRARVERSCMGIVLTAHPTFAQTAELTRALADVAVDSDAAEAMALAARTPHRPPETLTLDAEHAWSVEALQHVHGAVEALHRTVLRVARELFPDRWEELRPRLLSVASWVGYDHDGRTDITWLATLTKRLVLKREHLARLLRQVTTLTVGTQGALSTTLQLLESVLALALKHVDDQLEAADADPDDLDRIRLFARRMVENSSLALTDSGRLRTLLNQAISQADDDGLKIELAVIASSLVTHGLGLAHTHVRINATHLHNAVRLAVGLETHPTDPTRRRTYLHAMNELIAHAKPVTVNFGLLAAERSTARKMLMVVAKMARTIDDQTRVRVLIAETDAAFTLLSALYLARVYGIEDRVELSPLFETAEALEHGDRVIDEALKSPHYHAYVRRVGRLCVQFGYSDSGRYLGQMAATFGIERLRLRLAEVLTRRGLTGIELVLFDTHGESVGRGGHPRSIGDRLRYLNTPASRAEFAGRGITIKPEVSFQGADGWVYFMNPGAALAALRGIMDTALSPDGEAGEDPIYQDPDFATEFFAATRQAFSGLVDDPNYAALLGTFHTNMLYRTGSRPAKRQHQGWVGAVDVSHPSQLRAIPNNAVLQQLGLLANTLYGVGRAAAQDPDRFSAMLGQSPRFRRAMVLVHWALTGSDPDVLKSYMDVLDPGLWLGWAAREASPVREQALRMVASRLDRGDLHARVMRVHRSLHADFLDLRAAFEGAGQALFGLGTEQEEVLTLLHALKVALMIRLLLLATAVPEFSPEHGVAPEQIFDRVVHLDVPEAVAVLSDIFPRGGRAGPAQLEGFAEAAKPVEGETGYEREHDQIFDPMLRIYDLIRRAGVAISHQLGAMG